jgi:hypothetical protein
MGQGRIAARAISARLRGEEYPKASDADADSDATEAEASTESS